jgi:RHH-type transcriptional regulator, proline utilization regulon repressor / proline dehydrogenase / delta 1-pyrroline-5-carboxylate dehydrogenase
MSLMTNQSFAQFAPPTNTPTALRRAITAATRLPEEVCVPPLVKVARQGTNETAKASQLARRLVEGLRANPAKGGVQGLVQEYSLSTDEGVALMCLAEALLRIPDHETRDALIRDKISDGDWASHLGQGQSMFVNAATWGLMLTGKLTASVGGEAGLGSALTRLVGTLGEPVIRRSMDMAMRMMGEQFVQGQTIEEALRNGKTREAKGYRYSFDMLGEAATTEEDAEKYFASYENAIHAIGRDASQNKNGGGPIGGNGISIKLSALHPRYARAQAGRVMGELLPRVVKLAALAKNYDIGLNIDAEESERLEISLDLLEALSFEPTLKGWNGLGVVVQAYGKRCSFVIDFIVDLAKRADRRMMVRLVKGAYWDSEIKRAQVDGLSDFPVFTRKIYTDVSYLACARKLLDARSSVFPQFATHNAQTLAAISVMAGDFKTGDYEFQCLHGMGEGLYDQVMALGADARPCRIYAPVGTHETLLAYLVRRLLENGANSSFVNRIADEDVPVDALIADPVAEVAAMPVVGAMHEQIRLADNMFDGRKNSGGIDLASEDVLAQLSSALKKSAARKWVAEPLVSFSAMNAVTRDVVNPCDHADHVGQVQDVKPYSATEAVAAAALGYQQWTARPASERSAALDRAADILQNRLMELMGLVMREAGKTAANAVGEVREAIDFLRYYAIEARQNLKSSHGLGVVVCISPWNFPLAIFLGQVSAALAAGNAVVAKPAEETPLIAAEAIRILHEAGVPRDALQFVPGDGAVGAALVAAPEVSAVMFTGSTEVARLINAKLAKRLGGDGRPIPLIAETGGQNAMIVDSSALAEQVVGDVLTSAFDSAGQRCSALRVLCLQEDVADRVLTMIRGAMRELRIGDVTQLATDVGPVISAEARRMIENHILEMGNKGCRIERLSLPEAARNGTFVAPTVIEIKGIHQLQREVFGPVLHVLRFKRDDLGKLIDAINASGYGLTFGLHTRLDETVEQVTSRVKAGNIYVNRNVIGAVVGVQPFGGRGLSGTGPKAGGPLYLHRLVRDADPAVDAREVELQGPVGESNLYSLHPRGRVLCLSETQHGLDEMKRIVTETGNIPVTSLEDGPFAAALVEAVGNARVSALEKIAALPGAVIPVHAAPYCKAWLMEEQVISINTTASGGNASLMSIG